MIGPVRRVPAMVAAALFAAVGSAWIAFGSVQVGAGWSAGMSRPVRTVLRLADEAMAATGVEPGWRALAWGGAAVALFGGFLMVWLALSAFTGPGLEPDAATDPDR